MDITNLLNVISVFWYWRQHNVRRPFWIAHNFFRTTSILTIPAPIENPESQLSFGEKRAQTEQFRRRRRQNTDKSLFSNLICINHSCSKWKKVKDTWNTMMMNISLRNKPSYVDMFKSIANILIKKIWQICISILNDHSKHSKAFPFKGSAMRKCSIEASHKRMLSLVQMKLHLEKDEASW